MWTARRVEALKREAVRLCAAEARGNVRFRGPEARRHAAALAIEGLDGADVRALCARFPECAFFARPGALVAYVPLARPPVLTLARAAAALWAAAAALAAAGWALA